MCRRRHEYKITRPFINNSPETHLLYQMANKIQLGSFTNDLNTVMDLKMAKILTLLHELLLTGEEEGVNLGIFADLS